jgi:heme/copper-type cytochrome/quinol oxidase subunit 3
MQPGAKALATARWMATLMYVVALVVFQLAGRLAPAPVELDASTMTVLAYALLAVGIMDYGLSLFLEKKLLAKAQSGGADASGAVVSAALIVSALGVSLAVYGLVLTLLGAPTWGAVFYMLCAVHGLHLIIRWPDYARAAEQTGD